MIKNLFNKYKEIISYLFFGVLTTLVNFVSFWAFNKILGESLYFFSLCVEESGLWLLVDKLGFDKFSFSLFEFEVTGKLIAKVLLAVIVVILNYFFSKFIIFAKKSKDKSNTQ